MNPIIEKKLLRHVDREMYDPKGFVDYRNLKRGLEIKVRDLAQAIGVTTRSLEKNPRSERIQSTLRKIVYVYRMLEEMLGNKDEALLWLRAPNPDYEGMTPFEIILHGKADAIIRYLDDIKKGSLT